MSKFLDWTQTLDVEIRKRASGQTISRFRQTLAVLDTGYGGFIGVPGDVFEELQLGTLETQAWVVVVANGERVPSRGTFGRLRIRDASVTAEGFIATWPGLDEILVGGEALSSFRLDSDFSLRRLSIQKCGGARSPERSVGK